MLSNDEHNTMTLLLDDKLRGQNWFDSDEQFNRIFPHSIQYQSSRHWTPLEVVRKAANFLAVEKNTRILDIGSGPGKFCLGAAHFRPNAHFLGIEQRESLVQYADHAKQKLGLSNASFMHGNFTQLDFKDYHHFYFYNSFYENLAFADKIDNSIDYSGELYEYYAHYLFRQLERMPGGTRLATFHSLEDEIPSDYHVVGIEMDNLLKFWIKV